MTFPAARCPYAAKADGSGRPWNTVAVSFYGGKAMPRKRLEGRSLAERGRGE